MTDPGQHILPGADFTREVPLPPQPPLEDDFPCCSQSAPSCSKSGSSEDEVIPQAAIEAAAKGIRPDLWADPDLRLAADHFRRLEFERSVVLAAALAALEAALPHLRPLFTTATRVGYELGRREAGEEIAKAFEAEARGDYDAADDLEWAAAKAREVTKGDPK